MYSFGIVSSSRVQSIGNAKVGMQMARVSGLLINSNGRYRAVFYCNGIHLLCACVRHVSFENNKHLRVFFSIKSSTETILDSILLSCRSNEVWRHNLLQARVTQRAQFQTRSKSVLFLYIFMK